MKTLGKYEKFDDPILLRDDFIKNHQGLAYQGSKMKDAQELFRLQNAHTPNNNNLSNTVNLASRFRRPQSTIGRKENLGTAQSSSLNSRPITSSYLNQIKGHHEFDSANTLRNSVLPQTIPKAQRFKLEPKGSQFAQYKDPLPIQAAAPLPSMLATVTNKISICGKNVMSTLEDPSAKKINNESPTNKNQQFHVKRDTLKIKVDDYIAQGRPLWMRELQIGAPAPNAYKVKTQQELEQEKIEVKPNKCLFGEPYDKFKKTCDIDASVKIYDHSKHYASTTLGFYRSDPNIISPMDTLVTKKKNNPIYSIPLSKEILFKDEIERARLTPGPADYNQDDAAIRDARNAKITIPNQQRVLDKTIGQNPGPGAYETEALTTMARKVEQKISIHQTYSETMSHGSKSTKSTSTLSRPTSKYAMLKYFEKSRSSTSQSWFENPNNKQIVQQLPPNLQENDKQRRNLTTVQLLTQKFKPKQHRQQNKIEEDSRDQIDEEELNSSASLKQAEGSLTHHSEQNLQKGKKAPWRSNQDFIQFIRTLDQESNYYNISQPNIIQHAKTTIAEPQLKRNKSKHRNHNQHRTLNAGTAGQSANRLIFLGSGSLKTIGMHKGTNQFSHKDFI